VVTQTREIGFPSVTRPALKWGAAEMNAENTNLVGLRVRYLMLVDLLCILLALVLSFVIRFEVFAGLWPYLKQSWTLFLLVPLVRLPLYYYFRLYRRLWRYASIRELQIILMAGFSGTLLVYLTNFWLLPALNIPYGSSRSIPALEGCFSIAFLGGTRFVLRLLQERITYHDANRLKAFVQSPMRVLIFGAGDAGAIILREMQNNPGLGMHTVGFVDDNPAKLRMHIHGVPVLGTREQIPALVKEHHIDEVIIAIPTSPGNEIRDVKAICDEAGVRNKTVPGIYELIGGTVSVSQIRDVQIEDLLRRESVPSNAQDAIYLRGAVVMVTGAAGSIGSELSRQVAHQKPKRLVLLDQSESGIFHIHSELRERYPKLDICPVVADIRNLTRVDRVMGRYCTEIVFHAAAYKHVPLMEANPEEVVLNNILGTHNLLRAAERQNVTRFVLISTDKAVNPINFMGASKRISELLVQDAARRSGRVFAAVRFGNVLGSEGSVVPLFRHQIAVGGPVTVTHPEMERFFMTIPEAVQLVIQAAALGEGGEIFVLDMGDPVKIVDLASDLITLSGLQPGRDIEIAFTGLRPGEKFTEELFNKGETYTLTAHEKIFVVTAEMPISSQELQWGLQKLIRAAQESEADLWGLMQVIAPECQRGLAEQERQKGRVARPLGEPELSTAS
jgi:FlaA1/EpsC-like NDP-sugar epimerase